MLSPNTGSSKGQGGSLQNGSILPQVKGLKMVPMRDIKNVDTIMIAVSWNTQVTSTGGIGTKVRGKFI